jgi:hypothetical protein
MFIECIDLILQFSYCLLLLLVSCVSTLVVALFLSHELLDNSILGLKLLLLVLDISL